MRLSGLPRLRIVTALLGALVLVSIVPLLFSHLRLIRINREALETAEKKYLTRSAVMLAGSVASYARSMQSELQRMADGFKLAITLSPEKDPFVLIGDQKKQQLLLGIGEAQPNYLILRAVDREGVGSAAGKSGSVDPATEAELRRAYAVALRGETVVGDPIRSDDFPDGGFVVAVPVLPAEGELPIGVLEAFVSLAPVREWLLEEKKRDVVVYIVDRKGSLVLSSDPSAVGYGEPLQGVELVAEFMKTPLRVTRQYDRGTGSRRRTVIGTIAPVESPDWGVIVEKDVATAFASASQMTRESSIVGFLALAFAAVVAFVSARLLSQPLLELVDKVRLIAQGDLSQRVPVRGTAELAELSESFNHMTDSLERSVERLKLAARENQELFINSIRTLSAAIDAKDPYTRGHSERVARYSVAIGRHYGLPTDEVRKLRISALLHDVGKIGIDDKILRKPTALTDDEFEVMKTHPVKGALIIGQIPQLSEVIPGIKFHHEKWDGSGYPDGLSAEAIPLLARIVTVADTFDAMTTTRPYQRAMAIDYVVARIKSFSGTRFDPKVVDALDKAYAAHDIEVVTETRLAASA